MQHADNAVAALLHDQPMRREEDNAAQSYATESVESSLLRLSTW
ncbi:MULTISPECIES: hypothetical protein [unclassified Pantoea]|nr:MULTISPECIES: hypothetical protein [unclassified Pantoea]MDF2043848.1 hypothetical protein [Pantoea sp. Cr_R14]MDF2069847.1 hypothetical protein [Pantoea sp. Cr_R13]MDF2081450.1 hypothetical protein [Pantoea sp. Cr_R21]